jgi:hypothetical protein
MTLRSKKIKITTKAVFIIVIIAFIYIIVNICIILLEYDSHIKLYKAVNKRLGFIHDTPYTQNGEILIIEDITIGGAMHKAGFKRNDRFKEISAEDFYRLIVFNQEKSIEFIIIRENEELKISLYIPNLNLDENFNKIHWIHGLKLEKGPLILHKKT